MPEYPRYTLFFPMPVGFDNLSREEQGRVFVHLFIELGKKRFPTLARIVGEYTGSGDSWDDAEWIFYGELADGTPDNTVQIDLHNNVHDALDEFLSAWLSDEHPGWENNDGGFGTMSIDLNKRSIGLEHNNRFTSSEVAGDYVLFDDSEEKPDG
jgi:hypothetical protein